MTQYKVEIRCGDHVVMTSYSTNAAPFVPRVGDNIEIPNGLLEVTQVRLKYHTPSGMDATVLTKVVY